MTAHTTGSSSDDPITRVTPRPEAHVCGVLGCGSDDYLAAVELDRGTRTLCEYHRSAVLGWKL